MGHINFSLRDFYDGTSELVGIKSGILLNRFKISDFLIERFDENFLKRDNLESYVRVESGELTDMVVHLRQRVGNLPLDLNMNQHYLVMREYMIRTGDIRISSLSGRAFGFLMNRDHSKLKELIAEFRELNRLDERLATACIHIGIHMHDTDITISGSTDWDGGTPLSSLFDMEVKPLREDDFIDQKFIDYLASNGHEIETIHWRNFERFCAEYFKRQGYHAVLGPGSNDGGVDIRVYKDKADLAAALMLIQCKRYTGEHKVTIETVKAFYSDIQFEGANEGIIATTGYIASGGKKVCNARKYNISFAEKENIKRWTSEMKSKF